MSESTALPTRQFVIEKLTEAMVKVTERDPETLAVSESTTLREDLGLDSFAALELLFELEEMLNVRIPQDAAAGFVSVGDVVTYVLTPRVEAT